MIYRVLNEDGSVRIEQNDETRTYSDFTTDPPTIRPYNPDENAAADQRLVEEAAEAVRVQVEQILDASLADLQAIIDTPNATINGSPAQHIKTLARVQRRLIRHAISKFDATA